MEDRMPMATAAEGSGEPPSDPRLLQILTTEHWSLLATRSLTWNEAFSRTSTFLATLSATTLALALVGPPTAFGLTFSIFALVALSVSLFIGAATYVRLVHVNEEDAYWVVGMNLLRARYARLVPGVERDFVTGHTVDPAGVSRTFGIPPSRPTMTIAHLFVTTPAVVLVVDAAIAGVLVGLLAGLLALPLGPAFILGLAGFGIVLVSGATYGKRSSSRWAARMLEEFGRGHDAGTGDRGSEVWP
jgi:hypothetical protein